MSFRRIRSYSNKFAYTWCLSFSTTSTARVACDATLSNRLSSVRKRAETTLENIKGLIGYFDLDPARALDVILDVFADNVLYHHVFFRELLQLSPWAPKNRHDPLSTSNGSSGLLPDGGFAPLQDGANTMCAQILGFKFGWYTVSLCLSNSRSEPTYSLTRHPIDTRRISGDTV